MKNNHQFLALEVEFMYQMMVQNRVPLLRLLIN